MASYAVNIINYFVHITQKNNTQNVYNGLPIAGVTGVKDVQEREVTVLSADACKLQVSNYFHNKRLKLFRIKNKYGINNKYINRNIKNKNNNIPGTVM